MILLPLPRRVGPMAAPLFFAALKLASMKASLRSSFPRSRRSFGEPLEQAQEPATALPVLKAPMTRLIRRISHGQIVPGRAGAQHPEDAVQYGARIRRRSATPIGTATMTKQGREDLPLRVSQVHTAEYDGRGSRVPHRIYYF